MHQSHNIAWDSLSTNLTFIFENKALTPRRTDLFARQLESQAASLNHFTRTIAATIREFADTERAKYPTKYPAPSTGPLFPNKLLLRYCDPHFSSINDKNQSIENWIERAGQEPPPGYTTSHGDLADVVKVLIAENEMDQLLMLAQHPRVPLTDLHSLSWGHSFGWDHVVQWALEPYIFFNVLLSKPELIQKGRYKSMDSYRRVIALATGSGDYDAQSFPHREFFWGSLERRVSTDGLDPFGDVEKLHEYLKTCFSLLYRYDMLARECGRDVNWEGIVARNINVLWGVKVDYIEDKAGDWIARFV
ncbi:hypothetical protein B0H15DRAFT_327699 [Mycena belliarum]|uniref:Uncharacterized protein n=1 Tax=Mycena belliarum TaxID=1033014 RepID=A0AAD6XTL9_9AGAR|nr:hypothetical protein B0H15DRAFT_327699 [Mycena belliae]